MAKSRFERFLIAALSLNAVKGGIATRSLFRSKQHIFIKINKNYRFCGLQNKNY